jgi:hypothetical protein
LARRVHPERGEKRSGHGRRRRSDPRTAIRPRQHRQHRNPGTHSPANHDRARRVGQQPPPAPRPRPAAMGALPTDLIAEIRAIAEPLCRPRHLRFRNTDRTRHDPVIAEPLCRPRHLRFRNTARRPGGARREVQRGAGDGGPATHGQPSDHASHSSTATQALIRPPTTTGRGGSVSNPLPHPHGRAQSPGRRRSRGRRGRVDGRTTGMISDISRLLAEVLELRGSRRVDDCGSVGATAGTTAPRCHGFPQSPVLGALP